jgi:two-component system, OmpR family, sensor kinase
MGARTRIPLWVLLPSLVVSVVALGAIAAGAIGIAGTRGDLIRQADSNLQACAGQMLSRGFVAGPTSGPAPPGACDMELLSASGQLLTPPDPGPAIPARPSWLAAHTARPATVPGASGGSWRVLLEAVHYQPQRILFVYGPEDVQYAISGRTGRGPAGLLVMMTGLAGIDQVTGQVAAGYAAAAGAALVLLAVAGLAVTRAVLRPLRGTAQSAAVAAPTAFRAALNGIAEQMDASRTAEAAARRSAAGMSERLSEVCLELRTPVSIIRGFAEYYRQRGRPRPPGGDPMIRRAADEITRIDTLVARLDVHPPDRPDAD